MSTEDTAAPAPHLDALEKGAVIGTRTVHLTRADLVRYAGASGDLNPIHWSEAFATSVGLPGVIAHGMLTMGTAVQLVTDWVGDPAAVVDYQTRFTAMVPVEETTGRLEQDGSCVPGAVLQVTGKVGALDAEAGTVRIDLTVTVTSSEDARALTKAQAVVAVPKGEAA
jgi:hypothetical protein